MNKSLKWILALLSLIIGTVSMCGKPSALAHAAPLAPDYATVQIKSPSQPVGPGITPKVDFHAGPRSDLYRVYVFKKDDCIPCGLTRQWMKQNGIDAWFIDINNPANQKFIKDYLPDDVDPHYTPLILYYNMDGSYDYIAGYNPNILAQALLAGGQ